MKRLILYVAMMFATFALGIAIHSFLWQRQKVHFPIVKDISVAPVAPQAGPVVPVAQTPPPLDTTPETILVLNYDWERFIPWAVFHVMGHKPKDFIDLNSIELGLYRDVDNQQGYLSLVACDTGANCDSAPGTFALVTERRLFFATSQMPNTEFEYYFDGKFLRTDFDSVAGKHVAVLRGTLTKTKHGRKIAEHTFNFRMDHLGC